MLTGIDAITYGVENLAQCRKFMDDWGLRKVSSNKHFARFETLDGTEVCLRPYAVSYTHLTLPTILLV